MKGEMTFKFKEELENGNLIYNNNYGNYGVIIYPNSNILILTDIDNFRELELIKINENEWELIEKGEKASLILQAKRNGDEIKLNVMFYF
jgi:uncharacterized protein YjfI (DUF2170 family)